MDVDGDLEASLMQAGAAALDAVLQGTTTEDAIRKFLRTHRLDAPGRKRWAKRLYGAAILRPRYGAREGAALLSAHIDDVEHGRLPLPPLVGERAVARWLACPAPLFAALRRSMSLDDTAAFLQVSNVPGPTVLRVNVKRVSRPELRQRLWHEGIHTDEGVLSPWSLVVRGHANLWGSSAFRAGLFEVQDEGSQRIARHAAPQADDVVVDLCAGHGGKTLAMMAAFSLARMHVHDVNQQALVALVGRAQRLGQKVHVGLPDAPCDVVLVDAPCSSTGVLRRHADLRHQYNDDDLQRLLNVQRALLAQASGLLRTGGRLVYATCSVLREENDDQVAFVARHLPQLHLQHCERTLPHVHGCDGFFVAVFVRR